VRNVPILDEQGRPAKVTVEYTGFNVSFKGGATADYKVIGGREADADDYLRERLARYLPIFMQNIAKPKEPLPDIMRQYADPFITQKPEKWLTAMIAQIDQIVITEGIPKETWRVVSLDANTFQKSAQAKVIKKDGKTILEIPRVRLYLLTNPDGSGFSDLHTIFGSKASQQIVYAVLDNWLNMVLDPVYAKAFSDRCKGITYPTIQANTLEYFLQQSLVDVSVLANPRNKDADEQVVAHNLKNIFRTFNEVALPCIKNHPITP